MLKNSPAFAPLFNHCVLLTNPEVWLNGVSLEEKVKIDNAGQLPLPHQLSLPCHFLVLTMLHSGKYAKYTMQCDHITSFNGE